jgi:hypothetical protein
MSVISFTALCVRVCVTPLVVVDSQLPRGSSVQVFSSFPPVVLRKT